MWQADGTIELPKKLDLNEWIQFCLDSQDPVDRQVALEELSHGGVPPYLAARLSEMSARDESEVCRKLAAWIESIERCRSTLRKELKKFSFAPEAVKEILASEEPAAGQVLLQNLRRAPTDEVLDQWRQLLNSADDPTLVKTGLTILSRFGNSEDADLAPLFLVDANPDVASAALGLLAQQSPLAFKSAVVQALKSSSLKLRLHAVHLLRRIDEDEALKYLNALLLHKNPLVRQSALREIMLVPFDRVENMLLQYLGRETNPLLLVKGGLIGCFNPDPKFPLMIYDILLLSHGSKKHIMQLVLRHIVESIKAAGVLTESYEEFLAQLKQKLALKKSRLIIRCAARDLQSDDVNIRFSAVERLSTYAGYPSIVKTLKAHLDHESSPEIKTQIELLVSDKSQTPAELRAPDIDKFMAMTNTEKRRMITAIRTDEQFTAMRHFLAILLKKDLHKSLILETIRLIGNIGSRIDSAAILPFLNSADTALSAATIRALGKIDNDALLPYINQFLTHDDPRIKTASLESYLYADKEGALQYIASMLTAPTLGTRRIGATLLPLLDFSSAEPLLWHMLKYEADTDLRVQAGYMIAANPTRDGIEKLYAQTHEKNGELKPDFEELWKGALVSAESVFEKTAQQIEEECWQVYKVDDETAVAEQPEYSYARVAEKDEIPGIDKEFVAEPEPGFDPLATIGEHFFEFRWHYLIATIIMLPFAFTGSQTQTSLPLSSSRATAPRIAQKAQESHISENTQVGGPDWVGVIKSPAVGVVRGRSYERAIDQGTTERQNFKNDIGRKRIEYLTDLYNDENADPTIRMQAAAWLNPDYVQGQNAFEAKEYSKAELHLTRVAHDSQTSPVARILACQSLAQIATDRGDRAGFIKWLDQIGNDLQNVPGLAGFANLQNFSGNFEQLMSVTSMVVDETQAEQVFNSFVESGMSEGEARERMAELRETHEAFNRLFQRF